MRVLAATAREGCAAFVAPIAGELLRTLRVPPARADLLAALSPATPDADPTPSIYMGPTHWRVEIRIGHPRAPFIAAYSTLTMSEG